MLDTGEYIIDEPHHQFGNGYDQLEGDYAIYYKVATKFVYKAQAQDREDLLHTIMLNLAVAGGNNGHKPDNPSWMYRIASFTVAQYWRDYYKRTYGIDCGHCSNQQRKRCKADNLYSECPRAIRIESLQKPIADGDGHLTELGELINDDKAIDIAEWTDISTFLLGCPQRLIDIAEKRRDGIPLTKYEQLYLCRFWKKHQKRLVEMIAK
jgi:DNA-directed RNA polymerase specialized sigma24 family protein